MATLNFDDIPDESAPAPASAPVPRFDDLPDESASSSPSYLGNIENAFTSAAKTVNANLNPFSEAYRSGEVERSQSANPLESMMSVGRGLAAIPRMVTDPLMKAVAPGIASPMAKAIQEVGEPIAKSINPNAVLPSSEDVYQRTEPAVETALGLAVPQRIGSVPIPSAPTSGPFGIDLSEGQASGALPAIQREQGALRGTAGPAAQQRAQQFADQQKSQVLAAKDTVSKNLDPFGAEIADNPQQAAALVSQSMQAASAARKAAVTQAYEDARAYPGEIHAGVFEGMAQGIKGDLSLRQDPVIIDDKLTPFASKMIDDLDDRVSQLKIQNKADPFGQPNPANIVGINLAGVDQMRKRLSEFRRGAFANNASDGRAAQAVLNAFDDRIDDAVNNGLFNGPPEAVSAWNDARAAHADYRSTFTAAKNDPVGKVVEKIIGRNGTGPLPSGPAIPNDVADYLYGAAGTNPSGLNVGVANRIKGILGDQSPEWTAVKQGLFRKLVEPGAGQTDWGPGKIAQRLNKFLNSDGLELSQALFLPNERAMLQNYADVMRKMEVPQAGANWSNTATFMAKAVNSIGGKLGMVVGAALGRAALPFAPPFVAEGIGAGAAVGASKVAQAIQARAVAKQMPLVADRLAKWQKAVAAAQKANSAPSRAAALGAATNLSKVLAPLGISSPELVGTVPLNAQENQQNVPGPQGQQKNGGRVAQQRASGGKVADPRHGTQADAKPHKKATKVTAHYRGGTSAKRCGICTMFVPPDACTAVRGKISPRGLCDYFERQKADEPYIDSSHTVVSGANSTAAGEVYIDRRIPKRFHKYLAVHENEEAKAMARGMSYAEAHRFATKKERAAVDADGLSWPEYTHAIDGYLSAIEHEKNDNPPSVQLHVNPAKAIGHHRSGNKKA